MEVSSHEDSASEFCCVVSIFSMKFLGFVSKATKLLLTELVGQCIVIINWLSSVAMEETNQITLKSVRTTLY